MTALEDLLSRFAAASEQPAMIGDDYSASYARVLQLVEEYEKQLHARDCLCKVVVLIADYSVDSVALLIALWRSRNTVALMTNRAPAQQVALADLCQAQWVVRMDNAAPPEWTRGDRQITDPLLKRLCAQGDPGVVIFSSGSTGVPKATVHRALPLLEKHQERRRCLSTIAFLLFDHIGGLNTLFYVLFNGGRLVIPQERTPLCVAKAIATHQVQAITTSPTFLNLLLLSGAAHTYDLSSVQVVNYGTEPMPDNTLRALSRLLPNTRLSQSYGLTETGVIPARSEASDSGWLRLGDEQCVVRVVGGMLEIKSTTSMLGYVNEPSPFTEDGYFRTGDMVIQKGPYVKILGRHSEVINVGGEKVYPAEIENVLKELPNVVDVAISHERHAIAGNIVTALFRVREIEALSEFKQRLHTFCRDRLAAFQIPRRVALTQEPLHSERFKKRRISSTTTPN